MENKKLYRSAHERKVVEPSKTVVLPPNFTRLAYQIAALHQVGKRERQEDSFALVNANDATEIIRRGLLAIVADGMGGMRDGKQVSEAAIAAVTRGYQNMDLQKPIPPQLTRLVRETNSQLYRQFGGKGGSTLIVVLFYCGRAYWVSVGDSSLYLMRDGGLFELNRKHTYINQLYEEELEKETICRKDADSDPDGARLSEFMGSSELHSMDYNIRPLSLMPNDVIFLCSDGISSFLNESQISGALCSEPNVACAQLCQMIELRNHQYQDNYTGLIVAVRR